MTRRDVAARTIGAASLAASWGTCLWLRALMGEPPREPTLLQAALVLASFVLSLVGLLLVLNGARMLRSPGAARKEGGAPVAPVSNPDPLAKMSLADDGAGRADGLTRRAMRCRRAEGERG